MKIEIGKNYMTRNGCVVTITSRVKKNGYPYPFNGVLSGMDESWTNEGRYTLGEDTDFDLVKELMPIEKKHQELFDFFAERHGLTLIKIEMDEIVQMVKKHIEQ